MEIRNLSYATSNHEVVKSVVKKMKTTKVTPAGLK